MDSAERQFTHERSACAASAVRDGKTSVRDGDAAIRNVEGEGRTFQMLCNVPLYMANYKYFIILIVYILVIKV